MEERFCTQCGSRIGKDHMLVAGQGVQKPRWFCDVNCYEAWQPRVVLA